MNILFMTIGRMENIEEHTIYCDLLRCFSNNGHEIYTISPYERKTKKKTTYETIAGVHMLHITTGNIKSTNNLIEKGIATLSIEKLFIRGIKKYFANVKFDLVLYSTPPITFHNSIEYVKKRDNAKSYLLLKDIFPQNAVDLGMISKTGVRGLIYSFFRYKEERLYAISDRIGCMSQGNVEYVLEQNPVIAHSTLEICPNSIEVVNMRMEKSDREAMRKKYNIPLGKKVFVYGGNLGRPQGIPFVIECLKSQINNAETYFLIVGEGTEFGILADFIEKNQPENIKLMKRIPKVDYDCMIAACDVGLIFLDYRFTIPNFPSRLLVYLQAGLPVLTCTDSFTDIGKTCIEGGFGWWCESNSTDGFKKTVEIACKSKLKEMGDLGYQYLCENYSVEKSYETIMKYCQKR